MRIQETDRILKEARYARNAAAKNRAKGGVFSRALQRITRLFRKS